MNLDATRLTAAGQPLHDLRNAANALGISLEVVRRCIEQHDTARALDFLASAQAASERCRTLLDRLTPPRG